MSGQKLLLTLALSILLTANALAGPAAQCHLKVGWEDWKPYIYLKDGKLQGPEFEYLQRLSAQTGCQLQFIQQPWIRSLISLKTHSLDMLYGASLTSERMTYAQFSEPYRIEHFVFMARGSDAAEDIHLRAWLAGKRSDNTPRVIGLIHGFNYGRQLEPIVRNAQARHHIYEVTRDDQLQAMLSLNRIDGFIVEKSVAEQMLAQTPQLNMRSIVEAGREPMHLMFSKKIPPDIVNRFNAAISDLGR